MKPSYKKKIQSPFFLTFSKLTTYEASVQPLQSANYSMNRACDAWSWSFITGLFRAQKRLSVDLSHISTQYWDMTLLIFYLNQSGFTNQRINLPFSGQDQKRPLGGMVRRNFGKNVFLGYFLNFSGCIQESFTIKDYDDISWFHSP